MLNLYGFAWNFMYIVFFVLDYSFCVPRCTTKQRNTHRLSSKTSSANITFFLRNHSGKRPSPTLNAWLSKIILIWTDINLSNTLLVSGRSNLSLCNLSLSCGSNHLSASSRELNHPLFIPFCNQGKGLPVSIFRNTL